MADEAMRGDARREGGTPLYAPINLVSNSSTGRFPNFIHYLAVTSLLIGPAPLPQIPELKRHFGRDGPGQTIRADIRLDIRKISDVRFELSVKPRFTVIF